MDIWQTLGLWIAAFGTLACFSFAFKENVFFHIVESIFIGTSVGYLVVFALDSIARTGVTPISKGSYIYSIPLLLGLLIFAKYSKEYSWVSRYPVALLVGTGTGLACRAIVEVNIIRQISDTIVISVKDFWSMFNGFLMLVGVLAAIGYFVFTLRGKGRVYSGVTRVGRVVLMVSFATTFGNTVLGRFSLFIGSLQSLLSDWIGLPQRIDYLSATGAVAMLLLIGAACFKDQILDKLRGTKAS